MKTQARTIAISVGVLTAMGVAGLFYHRSSETIQPSSIAPSEIVAGGKQVLEVQRALPRPAVAPLSVAIAAAQAPGNPFLPIPDLHLGRVLLDPSARPQESRPKHAAGTYPSPVTRTSELILFLAPTADAAAVGRDFGLTPRYRLETDEPAWVFMAASPDAADRARLAASADPRVATALPNRKIRLSKHAYVPDDPYYPPNSPSGFPGQWHLPASNVPAAWNRNITGAGVLIGIVDDCLEFTHPDLAGNFVAGDSLNFGSVPANNSYGPDTSKDDNDGSEDRHGTCVAGVAAAVGGNGIGVTGAAPRASLAVDRITFDGNLSDASLMSAVLYHASGGNTNVKIKNHSYGYGFSYVDNLAETNAVNTSTAAGTIHVYSAGNSRGGGFGSYVVDSNTTMPQNSPDVITVAALGQNNVFSYYSSFGANVFVTAPSSSTVSGITTTDRVGDMGYCPFFYRPTDPTDPGVADPFPDHDYTSEFGGTSSAAPLVAGIMALGKQANPAMTVRLAQHCLVRSSDIVDPTDGTIAGGGNGSAGSAWITNGSPQAFKYNQNYGFGRINADKFVQEVVKYSGVSALTTETHTVNLATPTLIPDNNATGLSQTFTVPTTTTTPLESVLVTLNIGTPASPHTYAGDLEAFITSPSGTVSRLMSRNGDAFGTYPDSSWSFSAWTFLTNAFWGENPKGVWTVKVTDRFAADTGTWYGFTAVLRMGTPTPDAAFPSAVSITRAGPDPTSANPIVFTVKFNKYVSGVDASDFQLITTGSIAGASITGVTGGVDTYQVSVNPGSGIGTVQLKLVDNDSIVAGNGIPLGGPGTVNGDFVDQFYTVDLVPPTASVISSSLDGLYKYGMPVNVTLVFSKAVALTGGNLLVTMDTGAVLTIPPFSSRTTISATYVVFAGEESPDLTVSSLALSGGALLKDGTGNNATLTIPASQNLAFSRAILVDAMPPTGGVVLDGLAGPDIANQTSLTTISAHWSGFTDLVSGISGYRWSIGTSPGLANIMPLTSTGLQTTASTSQFNVNLSLAIGTKYFVTVEARDVAGNTSIAATDGVTIVDPGEALPTPPSSLDAIGQTSAIKLIWTPSPTAVAGTFYRLWFKPSTSPWISALLVDNLTGTTTTISSLTIGISYDFQLRTVTVKGNESAGVFTSGIPANPITVNGSGNYGSIQQAINDALSGDTVIVQGGTYTENLTLPAGVSLTGASPKLTILTAASGDVIVCSGNTTPSTISQVTVTGGQVGINSANGTVTLENIVIHHTGNDGTTSAVAGVLKVINCTIAHNGAMGIHSAGTTTVRNVIATGNVSDGVNAPAGATVTYTDSYANGALQFSASWSPSLNYGTAVAFTNEAGNVYTETTGSFSIDTGDPADAFALEPSYNGGRINLGAYGNTSYAATSPVPPPKSGGGGGGGGCGLTGLEGFLLLGLIRRRGGRKSAV